MKKSALEVLSKHWPKCRIIAIIEVKKEILPAVIIAGFVLATMVGRSTVSGVYRFIRNRIDWLREVTGHENAEHISRAHLPRFLNRLDCTALNDMIEQHFGIRFERDENKEWVAIDGKTLRGTVKSGDKQAVILGVTHDGRKVIAHGRLNGNKSSEIPAVRDLLKCTGLERQKVTLDAHHCNPLTTAQFHRKEGCYLIQVKGNQPILQEQCRSLESSGEVIGENIEYDKANGRMTVRHASVFSMNLLKFDKRWRDSGIKCLTTVKREAFKFFTKKTTAETSYYISNTLVDRSCGQQVVNEKARAIRGHWGVEADNYIRDKTFKEDDVKTKYGNQAQIMGRLRGLAMALIRSTETKNFQEMIDKLMDCPDSLVAVLKQANFL
ncbi:MAG: ISAs1 family transposase [Candidatus Electrothrix sp. GM3_4]|nr:ISAs1 family transposase [Candidatus Electrothrix sp. GM3_4]